MSPVTLTNVELPTQLATRHSKLSAVIKATSKTKTCQTASGARGAPDKVSTRSFTAYWVTIEHSTAALTAARMIACALLRRRT